MRFRILISALLLTKVLSISGAVLAIRQATVFDSEAKRLVPDQTILICDERILAVGPTRNYRFETAWGTDKSTLSDDGTTWTVVGSDTVAMDATVYVGLANSSHTSTSLGTATVDGVRR